MLSRLEKFGLNLVVYAKLINTTTIGLGFLSLLFLNKRNFRISYRELLFCGAVLFQLVFSLVSSANDLASFTNTLFYFSFLLVYLFLKDKDSEELITFLRYLIVAMFVFTLIEFVVLNSPFGNSVWYFPEGHTHRSEIMGFQRAQGLGAISSSSGAVAVLSLALYSVVSNKSRRLYGAIVFATIALLMSGTGFFMFFAYLLLVELKKNRGAISKVLLMGFLITLLVMAFSIFEEMGLNRFTLGYFVDIVEVKSEQYANHESDKSMSSIIFGGQSNSAAPVIATTSDFAIMGLFDSMGIYSITLIFIAPLWLVGYQKRYFVVLILYWLSWLHYPAMGSPAGCVFLGIFLAVCRNSPANAVVQRSQPALGSAI